MAVTTAITNQFKLDILKGGIRFGGTATDTFKMGLFDQNSGIAGTYGAATTSFTDVTGGTDECSGTGYSTGGTAVTPTLSTAGTTTYVDFTDAQWTTASFTSRACILYDDTTQNGATTDLAIALWDFAADKTVSSGTFTIVMPTADTSNALLRLS